MVSATTWPTGATSTTGRAGGDRGRRIRSARYLPEIKAACGPRRPDSSGSRSKQGSLPLVLGGDHSVALGTLGGARPCPRGRRRALDRRTRRPEHPRDLPDRQRARDAACRGARPHRRPLRERLVDAAGGRVGSGRSRRPALARRAWSASGFASSGSKAYTMSDIDRIGIERAVRESLHPDRRPWIRPRLADMDALDPEVAPGVGDADPGRSRRPRGASRAGARRRVGARRLVGGGRGEPDPRSRERDRPSLAVELVASALGKTIL